MPKALTEQQILFNNIKKYYFVDTDQSGNDALNIQQQITHLTREKELLNLQCFVIQLKIFKTKREQQVVLNNVGKVIIGEKSIEQWYKIYLQEARQYNVPKRGKSGRSKLIKLKDEDEQQEQVSEQENETVNIVKFPWKTKVKAYAKINNVEPQEIQQRVQDYQIKPLKQFHRPYFSNQFGSWEIDLVYEGNNKNREVNYLFVINVNTKYLIVFPIINKSASQVINALKKLLNQQHITNIKGDGERSFKGKEVQQFIEEQGILCFFTGSPFTQHNRIVDSVVKTIRNGFGTSSNDFADPEKLQQLVYIYNNTPHLAYDNKFSPEEVQYNSDIEGAIIRMKEQELNDIKYKQKAEGLFNFKQGNILMIHLDLSKTAFSYMKRRRQFNELAEFIEYRNGNVVCKLLRQFISQHQKLSIVEIQIYYCKKVSENIDQLSQVYLQEFDIKI